jgi:hypothetical protein
MAEHRKAKAKQWLDETFPATAPGADAEPPVPESAETNGDPIGGASTSAPSASAPAMPPPDPERDDVDEDDTLAPPSARPEARRRRERRERRKGGEGVTFAPGTSGDDDDDDDRRLGGDERLREFGGRDERGVARGRTFLEWLVFVLGIVLQIALDVAIMFTPSIKSRQRRYGVAEDARRRRAAAEEKKSQKPNATAGRNSGVEDDDEFRVTKRGTAGARQRALDRADVPPELRGHVSAAQWKRELRAFHEEQVRLAAAARSAGDAAPDAAATRKKARDRAVDHARREMR